MVGLAGAVVLVLAAVSAYPLDSQTVVVCRESDPYHSLALKIAGQEGLPIVEAFEEAADLAPTFVILVASPERLTAERLTSIGRSFQRWNYYPGMGIISGSTIELAEKLWRRRHLSERGNHYVAGDVDILQHVYEPTIFDITDEPTAVPLTKENLIDALSRAEYFYWTRHTGPRSWSWNESSSDWGENDQLRAEDVPPLKPAVVYSLTCSPFRPWLEDSIALAFADRGAAAYLGFVNTPNMDAFMKHGLSVPGRTSWVEVPLGLVAQIHNRATTRAVFRSPQLFMLGDPRVYLSSKCPYTIVSDETIGYGSRTIVGEAHENGVLAVKVDGAAGYGFISVEGVTSISENDAFYNHRLQTLNLGKDKYLLFAHGGGAFKIKLRANQPLGRQVGDTIVDALDHSWVAVWLSTYADGNPQIHLVTVLLFVGILAFQAAKRGKPIREYHSIFLAALVVAISRLVYFTLRADDITISANLVDYSVARIAIGCLGVFSGVAGGLILMRDGRRRIARVFGFLLAVLRQVWLAAFYFLFTSLLNVLTPVSGMTEQWVLTYDRFWLALIALAFETALVLAGAFIIRAPAEVAHTPAKKKFFSPARV